MLVTTPAPRDVWLDVLDSDPTAFVLQTPAGLDAICAAFGGEDASRLYEFPDGRRMILPLYRRRGLPSFFAMEISPLIGSLVSPGPVRPDELKVIFADLADRRLLRTAVSPSPLYADSWDIDMPREIIRVPRQSHILDLQGGFDVVWNQRFNGQARRAVRKAEKAQLDVEVDATGKLVPVFCGLLQHSIERWTSKTHEPRFISRWRAEGRNTMRRLQLMAEKLGDGYRIWVARVGGRPAAAIIVLQGANAHYTRGAMNVELAGPARASFLLQKLAIEEACKAGCRYYNMGETGTSEGLARFKSQFGAQAYRFSEYRLERLPITRLETQFRGFARKLLEVGKKLKAPSRRR